MNKMRKLTLDFIERITDDTYELCHVLPDDNLSSRLSIISKCIEDGNRYPLTEAVTEWYESVRHNAATEAIDGLKRICADEGFEKEEVDPFFDRYDDELRMLIYDKDISDPVIELLKNTDDIPARIEMLSDYDCINSHRLESLAGYSYENSYFGHMVDALSLNPRKVKEILRANGEKAIGRYPDIWIRNGKEQVSYEVFYRELQNSCCGANLLTYIGKINLKELYDADFKIASVVVPKGNLCGLFSSMHGGGSLMGMELKTDVKIELRVTEYNGFRLRIDTCDTYSLKCAYEVCDSFFGQKIPIVEP